MRRSLAIGSAIMVALLIVGGVYLRARQRPHSAGPGPLLGQTTTDGQTITSVATATRKTMSIGVSVPVPDGIAPDSLALEFVELVTPAAGLRLDGALASTGKGQSFQCLGSGAYPPKSCRSWPVEGWEINADAIDHGSFQIVLGLSTETAGAFGFPAFAVNYHDSKGSYRAVYLQGGQLCAPLASYRDGCPDAEPIVEQQAEIRTDLGL